MATADVAVGRDSFQRPLISPSTASESLRPMTSFPQQSGLAESMSQHAPIPPMSTRRAPYSKILIASYVFDWIIIALLIIVGGALQLVAPNHRAFTVLSLENSFPYIKETVPIWLAGVLAVALPIVVILLVTLLFVPGFAAIRSMERMRMWRLKLWELERGIAGLGLSLAGAFFITQCLKNMFGKPRPNMLDRCQPDINNISNYTVGGYGQDISPRWQLVTYRICTNPDRSVLDDGFRSFPSGHSSISWAGLLYLTLFLCSKFHIAIPSLPAVLSASAKRSLSEPQDHEMMPMARNGSAINPPKTSSSYEPSSGLHSGLLSQRDEHVARPFEIRHLAASPPNYLLIPAFTPIGIAVWICATRYSDFYHFGFDIIFGSLIGVFTAWFSFRWYHLPLSRGHGWAWGARSAGRAFGIGVGTDGYVGEEGARKRSDDERRQNMA